MDFPELMTRKQAAAYLTVSLATFDKMRLPRVQYDGRRVAFRKQTLDRYAEAHEREADTK